MKHTRRYIIDMIVYKIRASVYDYIFDFFLLNDSIVIRFVSVTNCPCVSFIIFSFLCLFLNIMLFVVVFVVSAFFH